MRAIDRATQGVGWLFIFATVIVLLRDGSPTRRYLTDWRRSHAVAGIVRHEWGSLAVGHLVLGDSASANRIVEFLDYRCVYCRAFKDTGSAYLKSHPDASILIRLAPRPGDRVARLAAVAAACSDRQGEFLKMHNYLLNTSNWMDKPDWRSIRRGAQITDSVRFDRCGESGEGENVLAADSVWVDRLQVKGTPTFAARSTGANLGRLTSIGLGSMLKNSPNPMLDASVSRESK